MLGRHRDFTFLWCTENSTMCIQSRLLASSLVFVFSWQCELWNSEPRRSPPRGPWISQFLSLFTSALAAWLDEHSRNGLISFRSGGKNINIHPCGLGINTGLSVGQRAGLPLGYAVGRNLLSWCGAGRKAPSFMETTPCAVNFRGSF